VYGLAGHAVCRATTNSLKMLFDRREGVMYELNETASSIVGRLADGPCSLRELNVSLCDQYEAPEETIAAETERFINDFLQAGLVTAVESHES